MLANTYSSSIQLVTCVFLIASLGQAFVPRPPRITHQRNAQLQSLNQQQQQFQHTTLQRIRLNAIDDDFVDQTFFEDGLSRVEIECLTISALKQQLRLRGLKVSGKKQELVDRLLDFTGTREEVVGLDVEEEEEEALEPDILPTDAKGERKSKAEKFAEEKGKEFIDVTAYLDDEDVGHAVKSSIPNRRSEEDKDPNRESSNPEVWGAEARIVKDFEGSNPVVDSLSRTTVEYKGSNQTMTQAYVVASRDALRPFLAGANRTTTPEEILKEIQTKREQAKKRPVSFDDELGLDEGDEYGVFDNILHRDFTDWGEYTLTGAQLSAQEVQGVLLLSDVYGAYTDDTKMLAEKIAFECQPLVVMVPDLFRGNPWKEDPNTPGFNDLGQDYEEWRAEHSDIRVSVDIRAAAAVLREQYGVSSIVVWGTCYGGGRALEAAAGHLPDGQIHDVDGAIGPLPVKPSAAVAWYPTRYNAKELFGPDRTVLPGALNEDGEEEEERNIAVMGVFAGNDEIAGATADDAAELKSLLEIDERVNDLMVKVFPDQDHGFAHIGLSAEPEDSEFERFVDDEFGGSGRVGLDHGDAEVACLLSTAFMETYSRVFLPTAGFAIAEDEQASGWNTDLNIPDFESRNIRVEIEDALDNYVQEPLQGKMFDPNNEDQRDELAEYLRSMEPADVPEEYKIENGDTVEIMYAKLKAFDEKFQIF